MLLKSKKISVALKKLLSTVLSLAFVAVVLSGVLFSCYILEPKNIRTNYQYQSVFKVLALALPGTSSPSFNCRSEWFG
jgi:hypothetical protein